MTKAFTLLETLLYLALAALILGGILGGVYNLMLAATQDGSRALALQEGNFILGKFLWALEGAKSFVVRDGGQTLEVNNYNGNFLTFSFSNGYIELAKDSAGMDPLNSQSTPVANLLFTNIAALGGQPEGIIINFTIQASGSAGKNTIQNFSLTEYLKQ